MPTLTGTCREHLTYSHAASDLTKLRKSNPNLLYFEIITHMRTYDMSETLKKRQLISAVFIDQVQNAWKQDLYRLVRVKTVFEYWAETSVPATPSYLSPRQNDQYFCGNVIEILHFVKGLVLRQLLKINSFSFITWCLLLSGKFVPISQCTSRTQATQYKGHILSLEILLCEVVEGLYS